MRKRLTGFILTAICIVNIFGCGKAESEDESGEVFIISEKGSYASAQGTSASGAEISSSEEIDSRNTAADVGVWYPYWDYDTATQELEQIGKSLNSVCFFAAYFDVSNKAFIPENTQNSYKELSKGGQLRGKTTYLTFVNDKLLAQGSSLKDTALLYELIGDSNKASAHAKEVIGLCKQLGCNGIEIDYEAIKKDKTLWEHFNSFVTVLSEQAQAEKMPLRIVFEPSAPISDYTWPAYPEYVMMCYNLNGYGTSAGPKANIEWLKSLSDKMKKLPGTVNMAFATGGFDFAADGQVKQIDYRDAVSLMKSHSAAAQRDSASAAMYFKYNDDSGNSHEVWYADQETLKAWIKTVGDCGINRVSIWRLGGNIA